MTISVLKMHFYKLWPKVISYRNFKKFGNVRFMNSLQSAFNSQNSDYVKNLDLFFKIICHEVLDQHAPRKKKYTCRNNKPFLRHYLKLSCKEHISETNF